MRCEFQASLVPVGRLCGGLMRGAWGRSRRRRRRRCLLQRPGTVFLRVVRKGELVVGRGL